jgi:alpha-N-arabinofuranosidase
LAGVDRIAPTGTAIVLTGDSPNAENSLDQPARVTPRQSTLQGLSNDFRHRFPAHSLTVLRLRPGTTTKG